MMRPSRLSVERLPPVAGDFVSLDDGRLLVRSDFANRFHRRGWLTASNVVLDDKVQPFRSVHDREVAKVSWSDVRPGNALTYLKRHREESRRLGRATPAGWNEAWAWSECRRAGVGTAPLIAVGCQDVGDCVHSFTLTEGLLDYRPADDFAQSLTHLPIDDFRRRTFVESLADLARRIHAAQLFHRDFYWCHFFVHELQPGRFDVRLIDLQRVLRPSWRRWRWRLKDLAQFTFSAPPGWLRGTERWRWFARYLGQTEISSTQQAALAIVNARAEIYRWRDRAA